MCWHYYIIHILREVKHNTHEVLVSTDRQELALTLCMQCNSAYVWLCILHYLTHQGQVTIHLF